MKPICAHCSAPYLRTDPRQIYCTKRCKVQAWRAAHPDVKPKPVVRKVSAYHAGYCEVCGVAMGSRNGAVACGTKCRAQAWLRRRHRERACVVACAGCGLAFCPLYGSSLAKLCLPCATANDRAAKAAHRVARKAKQRGAATEPVSALRVFRLSGWRCVYCGTSTPQALRGTQEPNAPELDHFIPLAKGGAHAYTNVVLACRLCNSGKSDRLWDEWRGRGP